jgi:hypothetical protein
MGRRKPTLQQLLELTRQVFEGRVSRSDLARMSPLERVFVAQGIMLAARSKFLDSDNSLLRPYNHTLEYLLVLGTLNRYTVDIQQWVSGNDLVEVSLRTGLHQSVPRRGTVPIVITPPSELVALVSSLGLTRAVARFLQDAEAGSVRNNQWRLENEQRIEALRLQRQQMDDIALVIDRIEKQYGPGGLRELRKRINERLKGH